MEDIIIFITLGIVFLGLGVSLGLTKLDGLVFGILGGVMLVIGAIGVILRIRRR